MKAIPNFSNYRVNAEGAVETVNSSKVLKARAGKLNMLNDSGVRESVVATTIAGVNAEIYGETAKPKAAPKAKAKPKAEPALNKKIATAQAKAKAAKASEAAKAAVIKTAKPAAKKGAFFKHVGVIQVICNIVSASETGITAEGILDQLVKLFPQRERASMQNTVRAQIGRKQQPTRMERERKITFDITTSLDGIKFYKLAK
tara:strand:+ start:653 stop:1258 length:606 start_codon:yes stop_codon:yes gene_type:complete